MAGRTGRSDRSEQTRQKLLDVGLTMLREEPAQRVFEKLQAQAVSSRAGVTTGSFYHHFSGQDGYVLALVEHALGQHPNPPFAEAVAVFEQRIGTGVPFVDALIEACARAVEWRDADGTFALQMMVWAKCHRDPVLARRLDRMYQLIEDETTTYYQAILMVVGREMRPPFAVSDFAGTVMALFEGLSLRRAVTPSAVPLDRMGTLLAAIIAFMTRTIGDSTDGPGWLEANAPRWLTG
jgi:AcrR family transcriptional regulator